EDKLDTATCGVLSEERYLDTDMRFSSNYGNGENDDQIDITNNSHYITSVFSTGLLTICSTNEDINIVQDDKAPGGQTLAEKIGDNKAFLLVVDTGATLYGGGSAPARRVRLPWGGSSFDIDNLNSNGETLMKRAIEWAAGGAIGSTQSTITIATWEEL
ncbi:hypothetical protein MJD09_09560, partial [bacterium]|nr:hypothetical protein [bacterium]